MVEGSAARGRRRLIIKVRPRYVYKNKRIFFFFLEKKNDNRRHLITRSACPRSWAEKTRVGAEGSIVNVDDVAATQAKNVDGRRPGGTRHGRPARMLFSRVSRTPRRNREHTFPFVRSPVSSFGRKVPRHCVYCRRAPNLQWGAANMARVFVPRKKKTEY